jgi:hypothetical protein
MAFKKAFKSAYADGNKKRKKVLNIRKGKITKATMLSRKTSSEFRSELTGSKRKGNKAGKAGVMAGLVAGRVARNVTKAKTGVYKMTAKHKAAISKALKGRKRK